MVFQVFLHEEALEALLGASWGPLGGPSWLKSRLDIGEEAMGTLWDNFVDSLDPFQSFIFRPWGSPGALLELILTGLGGSILRALKLKRFSAQFWTNLDPIWSLFGHKFKPMWTPFGFYLAHLGVMCVYVFVSLVELSSAELS